MDGTLVDNYEFHLRAWEEICALKGRPRSREAIVRDLHGTNHEVCQKFFDPEISLEESLAVEAQKEALYRELYRPHIRPVAGLLALLELLQGRGVALGMGTMGNRDNAQFVLEELGLGQFFQVVFTAEDVRRGKPHPDIFLLGAKALLGNWTAETLWIFEDTSSGIEAAQRAGGSPIGVMTSKGEAELARYGAKLCIKDYEDLVKILR